MPSDNSANYPPVLKDLIAKRMERAKQHAAPMADSMKPKVKRLKSALKNKPGSDTHSLDPHADGGDDGW